MRYYVYALIDTKTNKPFYIGKGKDNRVKNHFTEAETYSGITDIDIAVDIEVEEMIKFSNVKKLAKIGELFSEGFMFQDIARIMAKNLDEESAFTIESFLIKSMYGIGNLTNIVAGKHSERFRPYNNWKLLQGYDLIPSLDPEKSSRIDKFNAMISEKLDKPLREIASAFPDLKFDEPKVLDAGELGIEADIAGARIKIAIRRKNLYCELRGRKKSQKLWLQQHFKMLGKSNLLRKDDVFLPNCWKRSNMTDDIEEMKERVALMIKLVTIKSENELENEVMILLD